MECSVVVVAVETSTRPSRFAHFWDGAESLVPFFCQAKCSP